MRPAAGPKRSLGRPWRRRKRGSGTPPSDDRGGAELSPGVHSASGAGAGGIRHGRNSRSAKALRGPLRGPDWHAGCMMCGKRGSRSLSRVGRNDDHRAAPSGDREERTMRARLIFRLLPVLAVLLAGSAGPALADIRDEVEAQLLRTNQGLERGGRGRPRGAVPSRAPAARAGREGPGQRLEPVPERPLHGGRADDHGGAQARVRALTLAREDMALRARAAREGEKAQRALERAKDELGESPDAQALRLVDEAASQIERGRAQFAEQRYEVSLRLAVSAQRLMPPGHRHRGRSDRRRPRRAGAGTHRPADRARAGCRARERQSPRRSSDCSIGRSTCRPEPGRPSASEGCDRPRWPRGKRARSRTGPSVWPAGRWTSAGVEKRAARDRAGAGPRRPTSSRESSARAGDANRREGTGAPGEGEELAAGAAICVARSRRPGWPGVSRSARSASPAKTDG